MLDHLKQSCQPDGEICFLAVNPAIHQRGTGTFLIEELKKREPQKKFFLYTDDQCTYQFYEHRGFQRMEEKKIILPQKEGDFTLRCFIYTM